MLNLAAKILKWSQWLKLNGLIFIRKPKRGKASEYLCEQLRYVGDVQDFRLQQVSTMAMQLSLFYNILAVK